jgi:ribonuclease Z
VANRAGAKRLAITHVSTRYAGDDRGLRDEVERGFDGGFAVVAEDGLAVDVPYPDADAAATLERLDG